MTRMIIYVTKGQLINIGTIKKIEKQIYAFTFFPFTI
jgi:hypothetical protein